MKSVYVIVVRWVARLVPPHEIDELVTPLGDWFRFNGLTWFVETEANAAQIQSAVRKVLTDEDSVVVLKVDLSDFHGWSPPDTWKWLQSKVTLANALTAGSPFGAAKNALGEGPSLGEMVRGEGLGAPFRAPFGPSDKDKK